MFFHLPKKQTNIYWEAALLALRFIFLRERVDIFVATLKTTETV